MIQSNGGKLLYFQSTMFTEFLPGATVLDKIVFGECASKFIPFVHNPLTQQHVIRYLQPGSKSYHMCIRLLDCIMSHNFTKVCVDSVLHAFSYMFQERRAICTYFFKSRGLRIQQELNSIRVQ